MLTAANTADPKVPQPKGIMKSTPMVDKIVSNIWKRQQSSTDQSPTKDITIVTIEDTSTKESPGKQKQTIEVNLESTDEPEQLQANDNIVQEQESQNASQQVDFHNIEEHTPATTSPAKSSISDLHASDFFNPSEF